jgi:hypothetical protein
MRSEKGRMRFSNAETLREHRSLIRVQEYLADESSCADVTSAAAHAVLAVRLQECCTIKTNRLFDLTSNCEIRRSGIPTYFESQHPHIGSVRLWNFTPCTSSALSTTWKDQTRPWSGVLKSETSRPL